MKKVLITGATGFIGQHIVKANVSKGNQVRALVLPAQRGQPAPRSAPQQAACTRVPTTPAASCRFAKMRAPHAHPHSRHLQEGQRGGRG